MKKNKLYLSFAYLSSILVVAALSACSKDGAGSAQAPSASSAQPQGSTQTQSTVQTQNTTQIPAFIANSPQTIAELRFPGEFDEIASEGTVYSRETVAARMLPRGAAMITRSGTLNASGITSILHAAAGSSGNTEPLFIPTLEGVALSVKNSLSLARRNGHSRVAIPFIGSGIFITRIGRTLPELAETIIRAALENRGSLEIRFVLVGRNDANLFESTVDRLLFEAAFQNLTHAEVQVLHGNILNFTLHQSAAIVNAANMEVRFGGGISGAIGAATGEANLINAEAALAVGRFNQRILEMLAE